MSNLDAKGTLILKANYALMKAECLKNLLLKL